MTTLNFAGLTAFTYRETMDTVWMSRKMLFELMAGGRRQGTEVVFNMHPFDCRDGDWVEIRSSGKGSRNFDKLLRDDLSRSGYTGVVTHERKLAAARTAAAKKP